MKDLVRFIASLSLVLIITSCNKETVTDVPVSSFQTGIEVFFDDSLSLIKDKNIAVVANRTSLFPNKTHLIDSLLSLKKINLVKVFSPEHGFNGKFSAGEDADSEASDNFKLVSLYGKKKKPTIEDLSGVDLIIFDLQDLGVRYYTYISTLYYLIETCNEHQIPLVILDRPNPISFIGEKGISSGDDFLSFISIAPIKTIHGLTVGELAKYFTKNFFNDYTLLNIIKMKNWDRNSYQKKYFENWNKPSPNIPDYETSLLYSMNSFIEGVNISEGRGTLAPFKQIGAPFINPQMFADELKKKNLEGVKIEPISFTPVRIDSMSKYPKYENILCNGVKFEISDYNKFTPIKNAVKILTTLTNLYPKKLKFRERHFDLLWGNSSFRDYLMRNNFNKSFNYSPFEGKNKYSKYHLY